MVPWFAPDPRCQKNSKMGSRRGQARPDPARTATPAKRARVEPNIRHLATPREPRIEGSGVGVRPARAPTTRSLPVVWPGREAVAPLRRSRSPGIDTARVYTRRGVPMAGSSLSARLDILSRLCPFPSPRTSEARSGVHPWAERRWIPALRCASAGMTSEEFIDRCIINRTLTPLLAMLRARALRRTKLPQERFSPLPRSGLSAGIVIDSGFPPAAAIRQVRCRCVCDRSGHAKLSSWPSGSVRWKNLSPHSASRGAVSGR